MVGPAWYRTPSPAASSRSATNSAAASANAGTETPTTSRAVCGRSRVLPICSEPAGEGPDHRDGVQPQRATGVHIRSHAEIPRFFDGFELLDPGLVYIPH